MNYKVPFVDFPRHYHGLEGEIDAAIKEILCGGDFIMRQQLRDFEEHIASFLGVDYAVGVHSCTDAMHLSLLAAGVGPGDEVITVAHTFVATVAAIVHCGATPILVDAGKDCNMDMAQVEKAISPQTKAIIPVHLNGRLCDMERLMKITRKHNLLVIEDAAQALGAAFDGKKAGSFGLTGCFSFYPAKILGGIGDGGIVVTDDSELAEKIRLLRDHGRETKEDIAFFGFNSRLDNLQAAILDVKLKHLPQWIERRRELALVYEQGLCAIPQITTPPPPQPGRYFDVYTNYVVRAEERDKLVSHLGQCGIEILISWPK
ncbi:MAG: DegT/DnrJ/EryC1/StrS family aminotransferase, partial [Chloroflexi bacterium]|nr:DegT/DnrJ/EryC1/StrS family aminotransferase [Chloroflexota bacterium]